MISFDAFATAVEKMTEYVQHDPFEISKVALQRVMEKRSHTIGLPELRKLVEEYGVLEKEEVDDIINEVRYLPKHNAEVSVDDLARMIRDSVEGLPR